MNRFFLLIRLGIVFALIHLFGFGFAVMPAAIVWVEQADYRRAEDSPWYPGILAGSVHLENFISGPDGEQTFATPYISSPKGYRGFASGHSSVDGDDGIIDDFGRFGGGYVAGDTTAPDGSGVNFRFNFNADGSGKFPHSVGLVVTLASWNMARPLWNETSVKAFDASGSLLSEWEITDLPLSIINQAPGNRPYYTNGARFVGLLSDQGIASFTIGGVRDIDHVQYSFDRIPEPGVAALVAAAGGWMCGRRRRAEMR